MTNQPLPRASKKNTELAKRNLAVAKLVKDRMNMVERQAKAYLTKVLEPKDRTSATDPEGRDIATISMTSGRLKPGTGSYQVSDPIALAAWADAHHLIHGGRPSVEFPEWFVAPKNLESVVLQHGGEVPDGLTWVPEEYADPTITVRQTPAQQDNLLANDRSAAALLEDVAPMGEEA